MLCSVPCAAPSLVQGLLPCCPDAWHWWTLGNPGVPAGGLPGHFSARLSLVAGLMLSPW